MELNRKQCYRWNAGYTYSWDGGPSSGSQSQTNVCAGTYVVTATDANGCTATSSETITVPHN